MQEGWMYINIIYRLEKTTRDFHEQDLNILTKSDGYTETCDLV